MCKMKNLTLCGHTSLFTTIDDSEIIKQLKEQIKVSEKLKTENCKTTFSQKFNFTE